ncbi:hypothetical protein KIN20_027810 [Parelaphostrongylus tenuis]|uniref:Uncharacterized protein n=1 Tax=Parelaphostrongylus tenuis TaxID=148309 RepID=A0AAD5WEF6_PARTN|nr:hypothetical protein KIN20_027810 [Parelaphostrongylus tenuis]
MGTPTNIQLYYPYTGRFHLWRETTQMDHVIKRTHERWTKQQLGRFREDSNVSMADHSSDGQKCS